MKIQVLNVGQSGFKYCIVNVRLLSKKGEKRTVCIIKSDFSKTYSYTIMSTFSISRELKGKLFLCVKENVGKFRSIVEKLRLDFKMCVLHVPSSEK